MWLESIVARARKAGNASDSSRPPLAALRRWRRSGPLRTLAVLLVCATLLVRAPPLPFGGMLLPIGMTLLGETDFTFRGPGRLAPPGLIAWRLLNTLIAAGTLLLMTGESWVATSTLALFLVSCSGIVGGRGLLLPTAIAGAANLLMPMAANWWAGTPEPFAIETRALVLSGLVLPAIALLLHQRSRRLLQTQWTLRQTVTELASAQADLHASEERLQQWNDQLHALVQAQTAQLEERDRHVSIINAVSFALAEPMDDFRSLERAARLVARLMGARSAQAFHRGGDGEAAHLFVTVAPEDVHAPRLPEALLLRVAETGVPVISGGAGEAGLPDLGDAYAVVPIAARMHVCGAFALLGTGDRVWDDRERHVLLLVGREIGVSLENLRLYEDALERVKREQVAGDAARLMDVPDGRERAVHQALQLVGEAVDAWDIALVPVQDGQAQAAHGSLRGGPEGAWLTPLLETLPGLVADRSTPLVLGAGGEAPLAEAVEARGIGTVVLVPVVTTRGSNELPERASRPLLAAPSSFGKVTSGAIVIAMATGVPWRPGSAELVSSFAYSLARRMESDELVALQQQRIRELTGLADVARTMQAGGDVDRLYAGFAQALTGLVPYDRLYVARVDEYGHVGTAASFAPDGARDDRPSLDLDARHRWFSFRGPTSWRPESGAPPSFVREGDAHSLVVPMRPKGQMLGVVAFAVAAEVTGDQVRIIEQAVEQLALALDSVTLYRQATERASHVQTLSNLARIVASVVNLREAFAAFAEELRWLIPFDRAVMLLLNESEDEVLPYAAYPNEAVQPSTTPLGRSIAWVPVEAGGAVFLRRSDPKHAHLDWSILGPDAEEVAAVPVRNGQRTAAVFALVQTSRSVSAPDLNALDEVAGLLGVTIERLRLYERAEHSANHDLLTGLPNYRYLQERLDQLGAGLTSPGESAVMMIDMDGLKLFNDTLGHEAGDQVIRIVARALRETCRLEDFVARTGGDEFVVVMEGVGPEGALRAAERIHAALRDAHLEVPGAPARVGLSIGIATAPQDALSGNRLLHAADQAMYAAKFSGGHGTRLARDHADDARTRSAPQRDTRLVETVVRTATDGATNEEHALIAAAQRWVVAVVSPLPGGVESAPWVRMIVAHEALEAVAHVRHGRDQELARFFLDRLRNDWDARSDEIARAAIELAPLAVRLARVYASSGGPAHQAIAQAVEELRDELTGGITELQAALFAFVLSERAERRHPRQAA